jgi:hypothetical protein
MSGEIHQFARIIVLQAASDFFLQQDIEKKMALSNTGCRNSVATGAPPGA